MPETSLADRPGRVNDGHGRAPLSGIRVIEVGNYMAGPFCGMQLADLGAEVIKVEHPDGGDQVRSSAPLIDGEGSAFMRLNRNKRSVALDLKSVAASGWGQDGPLRDRPGMDIMAQARSGLMSITGTPGGDPVKVGVPICDLVCALYGALAAVAALHARRETGAGQFIDVSLLEAGVSFAIWEAGLFFATGEIPQRSGSAHQNAAPYQAFRASDGWLTIGATTQYNWTAMCKALGLDKLLEDSRYMDANLRHEHREALVASIEEVTINKPAAHWLELLDQAGVPCAPLQDFGQVFTDPHLLARDYFWDAPHTTAGTVRQLGSPMRFSLTPARRDRAAPLLGEDSAAVLAELGYDAAEARSMLEQKVVGAPKRSRRE